MNSPWLAKNSDLYDSAYAKMDAANDADEVDIAQRVLIISAPFGPFSRELAKELRKASVPVWRVILNGGDAFDWRSFHGRPFRGRLQDWPAWIRGTMKRDRITDIITYGDVATYAAKALEVASSMGIQTHILEQGYFRPDWITIEPQGVNAWSSLPRDPEWYLSHPDSARAWDQVPVGGSVVSAVRHIVSYHLAMYAGALVFPHFRSNYSEPSALQGFGHVGGFLAKTLRRGEEARNYRRLQHVKGPKFLLLLQRPGDSQMQIHSDFGSVSELIEAVCGNFAAHAPKHASLIVRPHPLDPHPMSRRQQVSRVAQELGISGSVFYSDHGKLHELLPHLTGVVCVNSTGGLAGVEFDVPTITLGNANYDMPGLTHQLPLEKFWNDPEAPDPRLYAAFRSVVMALTQMNGGYATGKGRCLVIPKIVKRVMGARAKRLNLGETREIKSNNQN